MRTTSLLEEEQTLFRNEELRRALERAPTWRDIRISFLAVWVGLWATGAGLIGLGGYLVWKGLG